MDATERKPRPVPVGVSPTFAHRLKVIASHRNMTMIAFVEKYLQPVIDREYRKVMEAADRELGEAGA